jgi:glycosyltransferase involved in cell wall biosynthesis
VSAPPVSVIICAFTEKRWDDVLEAVDSVTGQTLRPREIILVIDHNRALYERLRAHFADRPATEPDVVVAENAHPQGLSGGRNTGVAVARGEVVAFLDDDAVAEPGWLEHMAAGYTDPHVLGVGGATFPDWRGGARPAWFPAEFDWVVGCAYHGMPEVTTPVRNPFGGNSSFRRWVFTAVDPFARGIGRGGGTRPLGCEETEFSIRLRQRFPGAVLLYEPRAVIWHKVPAARARWRYFAARCYAEGLSKASVARSVGAADALASERTYVRRVLPAGVARGLRDALRGRPSGLRRAAAIVGGLGATVAGYAAGTLARARRRRYPQ